MSRATALATSGLAVLGAVALVVAERPDAVPEIPRRRRSAPVDPGAAVRAARRMNRAAGIIAASVLADSAVEHYRGSFHNKAMIAPIVTSLLSLAASVHGHTDKKPFAHRIRDAIYAAAALTGLAGTGFHLFNVRKKPGGFSWQNLFYQAPIGAPAALILSGAMGFLAERVRHTRPGTPPTICGLPAGRAVAAATSLGLMGTVGEAGLLHFRGAYHDPFMYLPVTIPPLAAALVGTAAVGDAHRPRPWARFWLRATAVLGFAGSGFHAIGIARNMGGWRNWTQNLLNGPPLPAPPSFTGLALVGLAALGLLEIIPMTERYPGYDVLSKRWSASWNEQTRRVIDARLAVPREPRFFSAAEWRTLNAVCDRIMPQPKDRPPVPLAAYVDQKMADDMLDGYRYAPLPPQGDAWRRGLAALEAEARGAHVKSFHELPPADQDALLTRMQRGDLTGAAWAGMPPKLFFAHRVLPDITHAYYAHPTAWNEIGFGGPASPRGYVRMGLDRRDPWEAVEAKAESEEPARRKNPNGR